MKLLNRAYLLLCIIWIIICLTIFPLTGEGAILPTIITTILSAPIGLIAMLIFSNLSLEIGGETMTLIYIITSLGLGYIQWFVILPKAINYYKAKSNEKNRSIS